MKIGNVTVGQDGRPILMLAPMAGFSDLTFRGICRQYGAELTVTEMVSAKALYFGDHKTALLSRLGEGEHPAAVQLFGREPKIMAYAAQKLLSAENPPDIIDINMGCPMPKITKNGEGSALMREPGLAAEIVKEVARAIAPLPVTVKIRKGWDDENVNAVEIARIAEENGAAAITVHGRTRNQFYSGKADWEIIRKVKEAVKIPVIGMGGISSGDDAVEFLLAGASAVMVGTANFTNPAACIDVAEGIEKYLRSNNHKSVYDIIGKLELNQEEK